MELSTNAGWAFTIAKSKNEDDKLEMYARRIQKLEKQLGRDVTDFSNWGFISKEININLDFTFFKNVIVK